MGESANQHIAAAVDILKKALNEDEDYRQVWRANIAMAFQDEYEQTPKEEWTVHNVSNRAAERFLTILCTS